MKLFQKWKRKKRHSPESAPQLTLLQRRTFETPGANTGALPTSTIDAMQTDAMIHTALTLKKLGVVSADYRIVPTQESSESERRAAFVVRAFEQMNGSPRSVLYAALDAFAKGWSLQELVFRPQGGEILLESIKPKNPALFGLKMDPYGTVHSLELHLPGEVPISLPREKFAIYVHRKSYSHPTGESDLIPAYAHWTAKQSLAKAWKFHLERFASPTVLGRFQRGLPESEHAGLKLALSQLQSATSITFPQEVEISTLGGDRESSSGFMEAIEFHNREIARTILGQTLTTDEGRRVGSLALGRVHLQVLLLQLQALRQELADSLMTEQIIRPLVEMNFGPGPVPRFEFVASPLAAFATGEIG